MVSVSVLSFAFGRRADALGKIHRQIGNAVPFALAEALGRELLKVLVRKWHDREIMEID